MPLQSERPPYVNVRLLSSGVRAYYFNPPWWAREMECCPVDHEALGTDKVAAYKRVINVLLPTFRSWHRGDDELGGVGPKVGTFEWLILDVYAKHRDFITLKDSTRDGHMRRLRTICDLRMADDSRLGDWPIKEFETEVADKIYELLLARHPVQIVEKPNGKKEVIQPGLTDANHIMKLCHTAWASAARSKSTVVPADNPFKTKLRWKHKPTYKATWDELCTFVEMADKMGHFDIATAAIVVWELHQRPTSVFGELLISHYRPEEHPNSIRIYHAKTEGEMWFSLFDSATRGASLQYEELAPRLEELAQRAEQQGREDGLMLARYDAKARKYRGWLGKGDSLSAVNGVVRAIVKVAGLNKKVTLEAFRHGGITGMADADMTDAQMRIFTRHPGRRLPTYIGPTQAQVREGRRKINAHRKAKEQEITDRILIQPAQYPKASDDQSKNVS